MTKKFMVIIEVTDEEILKEEAGTNDIHNAVENELGWLSSSGLHATILNEIVE